MIKCQQNVFFTRVERRTDGGGLQRVKRNDDESENESIDSRITSISTIETESDGFDQISFCVTCIDRELTAVDLREQLLDSKD